MLKILLIYTHLAIFAVIIPKHNTRGKMTTINTTPQISSTKPPKEAFGKTLSVITWLLIVFGIGKYSGAESNKSSSEKSSEQATKSNVQAVNLDQEKPKSDPAATANIFTARQNLQKNSYTPTVGLKKAS